MLDFLQPYIESSLMLLIVLLIAGFVMLVYGADWLVDGASSVAKKVGISDLIIGLTVVAFGTSMPEFVVNMISAGGGNSELAITNVLGSNAINIFVILGLTAIICPVTSQEQSRKVDLPVAFMAALFTFFFTCYTWPSPATWRVWEGFSLVTDGDSYISSIEGVILVVGFMLYMMYLTHRSRKLKTLHDEEEKEEEIKTMPVWKSILLILVGLIGLSVGGDLCVMTAKQAAVNMHVSDAIIGLTIVALGTSLPELATSVIAAFKNNSDLALGNCVGSCIFNVFFVLSISSCVHPLQGYNGIWLDALMAFAGPFMVWLYVITGRHQRVNRLEGASLLLVYGVYIAYRIMSI